MQLDGPVPSGSGDQQRGALPLPGTDSAGVDSSVAVRVRRRGQAGSAETQHPAALLAPAVRYANFLPFEERKPED